MYDDDVPIGDILEAEERTEGRKRERVFNERARVSDRIWRRDRLLRMRDAVEALAVLTDEPENMPLGWDAPPPYQGEVFPRWEDVPTSVATRKGWRLRGRTVPPKVEPWCHVAYETRDHGWVSFRLYAYAQMRPTKNTPAAVRAFLKPLDRHLALLAR